MRKNAKTAKSLRHWSEAASEAEEAARWEANQSYILRKFEEDREKGTLTRTGRAVATAERAPAKLISIRLPVADLEIARRQAAENGVPYQTWLKRIIHLGLHKSG